MKEKLNIVFKILNYFLVTVIILCIGSLAYNKIKNPNSMPTIFGYQLYVDVTNSMIPHLAVNDIVVIKCVNEKTVKVGDIITFREGNSTITHRVIEIVKRNSEILYRTKGDNNNSADDRLVPYSEVEGKYVFRIRYLGFFVADKLSCVLLILIVLIITFFPYNKVYVMTEHLKNDTQVLETENDNSDDFKVDVIEKEGSSEIPEIVEVVVDKEII